MFSCWRSGFKCPRKFTHDTRPSLVACVKRCGPKIKLIHTIFSSLTCEQNNNYMGVLWPVFAIWHGWDTGCSLSESNRWWQTPPGVACSPCVNIQHTHQLLAILTTHSLLMSATLATGSLAISRSPCPQQWANCVSSTDPAMSCLVTVWGRCSQMGVAKKQCTCTYIEWSMVIMLQ